MSGEQIKVCLVGYGGWGKNLARCLAKLGVLAGVCDKRGEALERCKQEHPGIPLFLSFDDVLARGQYTAVAIATEPSTHYELAKAALEAGLDVFVEKPLCLHGSEAQELVQTADRRQRILMVGHVLQYHPCVRKLYELVANGTLGKLYYICSNRLNLGKVRKEENALWSFAPHDISVILRLVGNNLPEEVLCFGGAFLQEGIADTTLTMLRFPGNILAHIYVSWLNPYKEQKLTVVGSHGMAVFDDTAPWGEKLKLYRDYLIWSEGRMPVARREAGIPVAVEEKEPLLAECEHFLECCLKREVPNTDGREALRVLGVLEAAQKALVTGRRVGSTAEAVHAGYFVHPTAIIDDGAHIGPGTKIWHFSHVCSGAVIGAECILGQNVYVGPDVRIGNRVKIQNNVSIYTCVEIEDEVFLGPSCVLTNVVNPRAEINRHGLFERTVIRRGATIGANATIVCGVTIGRYAFIAAGAVVTRDVPDYALMVGNPARRVGWMSRHGHRLIDSADGVMVCPESGWRYKEVSPGVLKCLDYDEDEPLPPEQRLGRVRYRRGQRA